MIGVSVAESVAVRVRRMSRRPGMKDGKWLGLVPLTRSQWGYYYRLSWWKRRVTDVAMLAGYWKDRTYVPELPRKRRS